MGGTMRRIKIVSDGTTHGTRVLYADTGEMVDLPIQRIEVEPLDWRTNLGAVRVKLTILRAELEIESGEVETAERS